MFIAHADIVVEGELNRRSNLSALVDFPYGDVLPLVLAALICQLHEDSIEILVY